ncbi:MAG: leucine-rich repeat domain-containing protein [Lachnospiraceae bacterium]|nr:leucine-rich repeat domain-containing protein [Lachnospiraceae bacterium]
MKKSFKAVVAIVLTFLLAFQVSGLTVNAEDSDYTVKANADGTVTITKYNGAIGAIEIPETINGASVDAIGSSVFYGTDITSVTIPKTVKTIGESAFAYCVSLSKVNIAEGSELKTVKASAFNKCSKVKEIVLPESVTKVGKEAFANMGKIKFTTAARDIDYANKAFDSTTVTELSCRQGSTTDSFLSSKASDVNYIGPYATKTEVSVKVANTVTIKLKQTEGEVTWKSNDESVATVEDGVVTGVSKGSTKIKATNQGETVTVKVTVTKLSMKPAYVKVTAGYKTTLSLDVPETDKIVWSSGNKKIATVNSKGKVTGKKTGNVTIYGKYNGKKYSSVVTVQANEKSLASYSTNAYGYSSGAVGFSKVVKTSTGYKVYGHFINGTYNKAKYIKNLKVTIKVNGKVVASKTVKKLKLNAKSKSTKSITITFSKSDTKKSADLVNAKSVTATRTGGQFYFTQTKTITKTVTKKANE